MQFSAHKLPYSQTNSFSRIVLDYLAAAPVLRPFYGEMPNEAGLANAITHRKKGVVPRNVLVQVLEQQYAAVNAGDKVRQNLEKLRAENTFTICTAHQPNLATGPLYFLYKIIHAIRLVDQLNKLHPNCNFVPVFYMGSEDADLEELNHFSVQGKKYVWNTAQKGAVGRMKVDAQLEQLILELEGQLAPLPYGPALILMLKKHFKKGVTIQNATFGLVHDLFGSYGLLVLIPDHAELKRCMLPVLEKELFDPVSSQLVDNTSRQLSQHYNVQAHPREINLFYLAEGIRERIIRSEEGFAVNNTNLHFTDNDMRALLQEHPERFSPNVILRGLFQETILPNIAFIGGGGELAYWLQLRSLFDHYAVPFPVLLLRNSFLLLEEKWARKIERLHFSLEDIFQNTSTLLERFVHRHAQHPLTLNGKLEQAESLFDAIKQQAAVIDPTLSQHVAALKTISVNKLKALEKKMLRAEKRRHEDARRQIETIRQHLFPGGGLQERAEGFMYYYALMGPLFIDALYQHSGALEHAFTVLQFGKEP